MVKHAWLFAGTFVCLLLCCGRGFAAQAQRNAGAPVDAVEAQRWREDLRYMASELPARHKNAFHTIRREEFDSAVSRLDERIPSLARHLIIVEMARIVAMIGDGHTNIALTRDPRIGFHTLPIKLYLFKDGLFVRAADRAHADLLGARVVRIGNVTVDEALSRVRAIISRDNEMDVKFFSPQLLAMPEVLHSLGLAEDLEVASFVVEKDGRQLTTALRSSGLAEMMPSDTDISWLLKEGWVDLRGKADAPLPLWLREPQNKFWFEYLPDSHIVYVQINQVGDKENKTLAEFSKRLFAFVDSNRVEKLVLDLRLNRGGNGGLLPPLVVAIIKSKIDQPGKLFTIIGRSTFSAAQFLINDLERYSNTLFVGEPSGSKGNVYGDSRRITLPNSGITVRASIYYWQARHPRDERNWTTPQIAAELTSQDYRTNNDPAIKAVLTYTPRRKLGEILEEALAQNNRQLVAKRLQDFSSDPVNAYQDTEAPLISLGYKLLQNKRVDQAIEIFKLNVETHPASANAQDSLGDAYRQQGSKELAIKCYEKALALDPEFEESAAKLKELGQK